MNTVEQQAIDFGNDWENVKRRLSQARQCLNRAGRDSFRNGRFDKINKRLVSVDGLTSLQWRVRMSPDKPESYRNQQTSTGVVICDSLG